MRHSFIPVRWTVAVLVVLSLAGCSTNPNVRKTKYLSSGKDYARHGKYSEAVIQFRNAIDIDPKFAAAHLELARAYLNLNNRSDAVREFQQDLALEPGNTAVKLELAPLLIQRRDAQAGTLIH